APADRADLFRIDVNESDVFARVREPPAHDPADRTGADYENAHKLTSVVTRFLVSGVRFGTYHIKLPPLTKSVCPVMNRAASLARKTAGPAISCGCAIRPRGILWACASMSASVLFARGSAVSVIPGQMALTVIPWPPTLEQGLS